MYSKYKDIVCFYLIIRRKLLMRKFLQLSQLFDLSIIFIGTTFRDNAL